jgi:hypothetical protein
LNEKLCRDIWEGFNPIKYKNPNRMVGKTTKPSKKRFNELGMKDVAEALYP